MSNRIYLLLDVLKDKSDQVTENLQGRPGVVIADPLQGPPDVMIVVEASNRQSVAELAIQALVSVETMTKSVRMLPTRDGLNTHIIER
jgi:predicted dinucleotide-utilizing enzyme